MDLDRYTLVLLMRPDDAPDLPDDELERLQQQHLAHLDAMIERGVMAVAGPFGDRHDERFRGMCLYRVGIDEARALAEQDPAVKAGRLRVDVLTWFTPEGALAFPLADRLGNPT